MPKAKPERVIMFRVMSVKYINTRANSTERGMLIATMMVGFTSFKNSARITIASAAPRIMLERTDSMMMSI